MLVLDYRYRDLFPLTIKFVSLETLRRCGFSDKRDARKQLHNRAKVNAIPAEFIISCLV